MGVQLSYSASEKYSRSPRSYYFHYIRRIREAKTGSALVFGNAIDGAINQLLVPKDNMTAEEMFYTLWETQEVNGVSTDLKSCQDIKYSKADYDPDILTGTDLYDIEKGHNQNWVSLQRKGLMIIDAYRTQIVPRIKRVIAVQKHVSITNDTGDTFIGFVDLICEWEDGRILICDNKTSSIKYDKNSATESKQLATYFEAMNSEVKADGVAYIVIPKKFRKKKLPLIEIDVVFGEISEKLLESTFQEYEKVLNGVKMGEFPCLSPACDMVWGECCYKKLCTEGSMEGLIELPKSKK